MELYCEALTACGVTGYSWEDFVLDYRIALIEWFLVPIQDAADGSAKDYWWPKMQCTADALTDWAAIELL